jgi:integrase
MMRIGHRADATLVGLVDSWTVGAGIISGPLLRSINKAGRNWGHGFTPKVIWAIVKANAKSCGLPSLAPRDLRRTCARLCHQAGGELDQIQFLLGYVSIQTTERYLGRKQAFFTMRLMITSAWSRMRRREEQA